MSDETKQFPMGKRAVVFIYTNTEPKYSGLITAETEHFVEIETGKSMLGSIRKWFPKTDVEVVINPT